MKTMLTNRIHVFKLYEIKFVVNASFFIIEIILFIIDFILLRTRVVF